MVDRQITEQSGFHPYQPVRAFLAPVYDRVKVLLSDLAGARPVGFSRPGWVKRNTLPLAISAFWVVALGAYAVGYLNRMQAAGAGAFLPTLELMFLCFAIAGPIAMVWVVTGLLRRTERLSDTIADQNETVLALATSVSALAESMDMVSDATAGRLDTACKRMEANARSSAEKLDRSLDDIVTKVDSTLLDSVILLDRATRDRTAHVEKLLEKDRALLIDRLDADAETLSGRIEGILGGIDDKIGKSLTGALDDQRDRVEAATAKIDNALATLAEQIDEAGKSRADFLDDSVRQNIASLRMAVKTATEMLESGLVQPVARITARLEGTASSIAAHPPASAEELAKLLEEAATGMVKEERTLLAENVARIGKLEEVAEVLLRQIDKTSRLNPHMEGGAVQPPAEVTESCQVLPLDLPAAGQARAGLNWSALVDLLDGGPVQPGMRQVVEAVLSDPDVHMLVDCGRAVLDAFAEESVYVEDLPPEHLSANLWLRFGQGERGGEIARLAGIEDEITLAIVRSRLRRDGDLQAKALRFAEAYARLTERAADQIGEDPRTIEMADTQFGRAFLLVASLLGMFERRLPEVAAE